MAGTRDSVVEKVLAKLNNSTPPQGTAAPLASQSNRSHSSLFNNRTPQHKGPRPSVNDDTLPYNGDHYRYPSAFTLNGPTLPRLTDKPGLD